MFQKLPIVALLMVMALTLSACGGQAPAAPPAPSSTANGLSASETPVTDATNAAQTPSMTPEATATPSTPRPTNEPGCTNSASFVTDVSIPDNSVIDAGGTFTKTWRVRNSGTCIWAWDYILTHYSEDQMGAPEVVPLEITLPGQTLDISVELTAPGAPGTYRGNFVIKNPDGLIMQIDSDSRLWLIINVNNTAATPTPAATSSAASTSAAGAGDGACSFTTDRSKLTEAINALNTYRSQNGLPAYTVNSLLARAAQAHANDMACNNLFVHTGSDGSTPKSRVAAAGYAASSVSENVYGSNPALSGQGAVSWWATDTTDPAHNQNLLSKTYTEIGVGYAFFDNFGYYVLVFAAP